MHPRAQYSEVIALAPLFQELAIDNHGCSVAKSCLTLCDPADCSPLGSCVLGFPRQECWSGLPFPSPGDLPDSGIELASPALAGFFTAESAGKPAQLTILDDKSYEEGKYEAGGEGSS